MWVKKSKDRIEYCRIDEQEPYCFKISSGITGTDLKISFVETSDAGHAEAWLNTKTDNLKRNGFVPIQNNDYALLFIRSATKDFGNTNDFYSMEKFKKVIGDLLYHKGLGYLASYVLKSDYWELTTHVLDYSKARELINYTAATFGYDGIELLTPVTNHPKQ